MEGLSITMMGVMGALAGGFVGAAFGALLAFVFTGFAILAGIGVLLSGGAGDFLTQVAFGSFFGPHISFAGGVAAAAYAGGKGYLESGRDIVTPLASLGKPDVLFVGAGFGLFGYLVQSLLLAMPSIGTNTDGIALTVVISAVTARLVFGKTGLVGTHSEGVTGWAKFKPTKTHAWLPYQDGWAMTTAIGFGVGGMSAWAAVEMLAAYPEAPAVIFLGFAISAISVLCLGFNMFVPVTHHITAVSAVTAAQFMVVTQNQVVLVLVGALGGLAAALLGQCFSRFWLIRGDSHIDPPASAIWPLTTAAILLATAIN
ncbi:hypothetical protein [Thioclava indica]|uniref:DUF7973 domain-containing protein n=1 Tax=Thioclava indica TaxID=1353528 RepID=A0A074KGT8_9RHOB|nr:hypothetical protein [Thioclava indica]KEO60782.1 hypothetical protein DT23_12515 [Thioclava indica]